ncbi:hypothetical protein B0T16DRAFT_15025 [Cercophora newfieldiana]|uniref:C2H2-type domain-containing protein n=1 Tax=Cercophora newfieldiana TaxID=92897 RepID=A0AA40CXX1_9PEZI|nr:hypothetical protein B0T16DRAFT_15025 [Cercophora newfieldiana]
MSTTTIPPRVMHDEGPFAAAVRHHHGNHGSHQAAQVPHGLSQAAVTAADHVAQCPYEAKVVTNGTTARMVLMFLRELVEQPVYPHFQQTYGCPMMKCYAKFTEPFPLVQHLLSCPELPNGEFDCDKCNNWHEFPTNEKDWSQWTGWSGKSSHRHHHHQATPATQTNQANQTTQAAQTTQAPPQHDLIERKRSFSSKVRDHFTRKKDPRKPPMENHTFSRPGTAVSGASSVMTMSRCSEHQPMEFSAHSGAPGFTHLHKPTVNPGGAHVENSMFWSGINEDAISSTVSSIAPSSNFDTDTPNGTSTVNTSQTTLFTTNNGLGPYQPAAGDVITSPFMFTSQSAFESSAPLPGQQASSDMEMSIDEPLPISEATISPTGPATPSDNRTWWGGKPNIDTPRPTPVSSPFYSMDQPMSHHLTRTMSQESMEPPMPGLFQRGMSEGTPMDTMSPHAEHVHTHHGSMGGRSSPTDDLVCDECQWKPRGVRENLRGYLRKHKNTHKGLRLPCDVAGCTKTFSRLDNLKKHKKDKHGIDEPLGGMVPMKRGPEEYSEHVEEDGAQPADDGPILTEADLLRRIPTLTEQDLRELRNPSGDYGMLWPALHF